MKFKTVVVICLIAFLLGSYVSNVSTGKVKSITEAISEASGGKNTYYETSTGDLLESGEYRVVESYYEEKFYVILEKESKRYWISMLVNTDSKKFDINLFEVSRGDTLIVSFDKDENYVFNIEGISDVEDETK